MTRTPPLSSFNKFHVLQIDEIDDSAVSEDLLEKDVPPYRPTRTRRRPRWEKRIRLRTTIAGLNPSPRSLIIPIELETTDTASRLTVQALIDSGATGTFIDKDFVRERGINTRTLSQPIAVFNVDGSANEAGEISEVVDLVLRYRNHSERVLFAVTGLGKQKVLLGHTWLKEHNPEIDWQFGEVKMSCCPTRCAECREQRREE